MKSVLKFLVLVSLVIMTSEAHAILPEGHDFASRALSTWTEVKEKVTQKVQEWWGEFNKSPEEQKKNQQQAAQKPQKPVAAPAPKTQPTTLPAVQEEPLFVKSETDPTLDDVKKAKSKAKQSQAYGVSEKGRPADPTLKRNAQGVPFISPKELAAIKSIPRMDVGREDRISKADFTLPNLGWSAQSPKDLKPLATAQLLGKEDLKKALGGKFMKAGQERKLNANFRPMGEAITLAKVKDYHWPVTEIAAFTEKPYQPLSEEELKMVAALILFAKGTHCHMVMGLMSELSEKPSTKYEALYHLGACADQLKMNEASFKALTGILKSKTKQEYASEALEILALSLHKDSEKAFYEVVKEIDKFETLLTPKSTGPVYYRMAKGAFKSKHYNRTWQHASKVPETSDYWAEAQLLASMGYFHADKKKLALDKLVALQTELDQKGYPNNNVKALVKTNLARMKFLHGNIDEAIPLYVTVPKDHGLWVQALIEQGWAQLYMEDPLGAIGNMYSLHSPYFKIVYQPESFVVRTIGYLNICQYGDAYKTLSKLEEDYRKWNVSLGGYMTPSRQPSQIYDTVRTYLAGKSTDDVAGLPYQILREAARNRDFLNSQVAINEKSDEVVRYEGVNTKIKNEKASIRERERQAKKRFDEHRNNARLAVKDKAKATRMDEYKKLMKFEKELVVGLRFQLAILEQSRQGYLKFQTVSQKEVEATKMSLKGEAGTQLANRMKDMKDQMARVLDNNEFLRYEVFAGSGENIRYQVAGGEVSNETRVPASIKPQKSLNWSFDGEFWEDEIGNYRSSLRNNCPQDQAMLAPKGEGQ